MTSSPQLQVRQHNAITTARYEYSEIQLDIFFYLLSLLKVDDKAGDYEINVNHLSSITGKQYNYTYLKKATEDMGSRMFEINTNTEYIQLWMFQQVKYIKGEGRIEIKLSEGMRPYLFDLKENFTSFQLYSALRLTSKYAKRIYTICSQWKSKGETPKYSITELKQALNLIDSKTGAEKFELVALFRKYVLDEAIKQINQHTDLEVSYELEKVGRAFKYVRFSIKSQPLALNLPETRTQTIPSEINSLQAQNARQLLEQYGIKDASLIAQIMSSADLIQLTNKFAYDLQTGKVKADKNPGGLLLTVLGIKRQGK